MSQKTKLKFNEGVLGQNNSIANKFNDNFNEEKQKNKDRYKKDDQEKLDKLNNIVSVKPLYDFTIMDILVGIKDSWFEFFDDIFNQQFVLETFTKNYRLFFMGLTLCIICIILYLYNFLVESEEYNNFA
jgi:Ethanolamine utilization protein EutJ (predicted chaperonin)